MRTERVLQAYGTGGWRVRDWWHVLAAHAGCPAGQRRPALPRPAHAPPAPCPADERHWRDAPELAGSETPEYLGRAVAALAADASGTLRRSGQVGTMRHAGGWLLSRMMKLRCASEQPHGLHKALRYPGCHPPARHFLWANWRLSWASQTWTAASRHPSSRPRPDGAPACGSQPGRLLLCCMLLLIVDPVCPCSMEHVRRRSKLAAAHAAAANAKRRKRIATICRHLLLCAHTSGRSRRHIHASNLLAAWAAPPAELTAAAGSLIRPSPKRRLYAPLPPVNSSNCPFVHVG